MSVTTARMPLSFGQEQLWFIDELDPGRTTYNILLPLRMRGPLDVERLRRCLTLVVAQHDALRATVTVDEGTPYQVIAPPGEVELDVVDLTALGPDKQQHAIDEALRELTNRPFDLSTGPLYRFSLYRLGPDDHLFCENFHHLVTDGWSSGIMNSQLSAAYRALADGREPEFSVAALTYPEFARQQREHLQGETLEEELRFWEEHLAGLPPLELPTDRPRPMTATHHGDSVMGSFPDELLPAVRSLSEEHGVTLFMTLATALNVVLSRYTGQEDIPVGVPMLGRHEPELEEVVGLFINMAVLRSDLSGDPTFAEMLERVADANIDLYEHQEVAFHQVVSRVQPVREASRNPLFQVAVQLLGGAISGDNLELPGLTTEYVMVPSVGSRFDFAVNFFESGDELQVGIEYSTDLFDRWRIEALLGHIETVLRAAAADPSLRLSQLPMLTDVERDALIEVGLGEVVPYVEDPLHVALAKVAAATPDAVALVCNGVELTYAEFDRRADRLARYLRSLGLTSGQVVAIVLDRSLDAYVAMLGVLKAGAAFTMLDPKHPAARLDFMLRDTATPLVLTQSSLAERLPESTGWAPVLLDSAWSAVEAMPADEPLPEWSTRESLAYVLYTSGSTGTPKGVMIAHRAVALFAEGYRRTFDFGPQDRLLQLPSLTFDMSQGEMWTAFLVGATVVAVAPEESSSPEALAGLMREQRVTYAGLPPAIQSVLEAQPYPELKYIMGGAEVLPPELVVKWNLPGRRFVNLYGPTEAAIACTEYECPHIQWQSPPPIGRPQVNRQVYIVDKWRNLAPRGVPGELLIGGEPGGLARGYLNQPELTAEKFVTDPVHPDRTVYRSGDLVRWNADLQIEFLGRVDNQVKLRGLRIELGEIEAALQTHPDVRIAVVALRPDRRGENRLVGYVVPTDGRQPAIGSLRLHLSDTLPEYMVPTAWVILDELPMGAAGWKIDRKALPDPAEDEATGSAEAELLAPSTPTEQAVAEIFAEILGVARVGADQSFFTIGGNSLQAMRVVSRINKTFGIKVSVRKLYGNATVAGVAAAVDQVVGGKPRG
ncbi:MAG: non-ribosomal peptide synthetase [Micromonosporaceae bacterium]